MSTEKIAREMFTCLKNVLTDSQLDFPQPNGKTIRERFTFWKTMLYGELPMSTHYSVIDFSMPVKIHVSHGLASEKLQKQAVKQARKDFKDFVRRRIEELEMRNSEYSVEVIK